MTSTATPVDNGVNVEALLGAREALTEAPEAAEFQWRATASGRTAPTAARRSRTSSASARSRATARALVRHRPPRDLRLRGQRRHAGRVRPRRPRRLPHRRRRGRRPEPRDPAARSSATLEGDMDVRGILGIDSDVRNGFSGIKVTYDIDADARPTRSRRSSPSRRSARRSTTSSPTRPTSTSRSADRTPAERQGGSRAHHHRRHRRRPRRPGHEPLPLRPLDRPRRPRARRGRQLVAHGAVGLAAAAHAQLAVPAARLRLRGRRPRRLHDDARGRRLHRRLREADRRAGADRHDGDVGAPHRRTATGSPPTRASGSAATVVLATGAFNVPHVPAVAAAVPAVGDDAHADGLPQPGQLADGGVLVVGASATRRADRPRDPALGPAGHAWPSASTCAGRACTGAATSTGGWRRPACSTSATTRSTTSCGPAACRRCSWPARPSGPPSTSTRSPASACELVGRLAGIRDGRAQFSGSLRNKCELADLKLGRLLDTIDEWATANGLDDSVPPPHRFAPTRRRRAAVARARPHQR